MAIERRLTEIVGPVGGKLHTARSRNDQVATDVAMFVRAHTLTTCDQVTDLMRALVELADAHIDWPMPGYTHLQRAQPVYLGHHLLAHFWRLARDQQRFEFCLRATDRLRSGQARWPASTSTPTASGWRASSASRAWSRTRWTPSPTATSSRLRGRGGDVRRRTCRSSAPRSCSGRATSSASARSPTRSRRGRASCPRRRTPTRPSCCARRRRAIVGRLVGVHGALHGLPLTYNKDLQEDKEALFDAADTLALCLSAATGMLGGIHFRRERLEQASADEMLAATDVADLLVKQGVPFREAHGIVAGLVRTAVDSGRTLSGLTDEEIAELAPALGDPADFRRGAVERRVARVEALARRDVARPGARAARARPRAGCLTRASRRSTRGRCTTSHATSSAASCATTGSPAGSSRSRATTRRSRPATPSRGSLRGRASCSVRPGWPTCTAHTASTRC